MLDYKDLRSGLPFLSERMKIKKRNELVSNLYDKKEYVTPIRALKQALNDGLMLRKVHRVIRFNQEAWLKPYMEMNTEKKKKKQKMVLKKIFSN